MTRDAMLENYKYFKSTKEGSHVYFGYLNISFVIWVNWMLNPMLTHMNKRGHLTSYWVVNDDDEMDYVMRNTTANAIMTDRPKHLQSRLLNYR